MRVKLKRCSQRTDSGTCRNCFSADMVKSLYLTETAVSLDGPRRSMPSQHSYLHQNERPLLRVHFYLPHVNGATDSHRVTPVVLVGVSDVYLQIYLGHINAESAVL